MRHWLGNALRGLCMGAADAVPGVSGGTIALILGIYARLIDAIGGLGAAMLRRARARSFWSLVAAGLRDPSRLPSSPAGNDAGRVLFLASLAVGILPAFAAGAQVLPPLLGQYPAQMRGFFLGLVLASVVVPWRELEHRGMSRWILSLVACLVTAWFVGLPEPTGGHARGVVTLEFAAPIVVDVRLTPQNLTLLAPGDGTRGEIAYGLTTTLAVPAGATSVEAEVVARMAGSVGNVRAGAMEVGDAPFAITGVVQPTPLIGGRNPALAYVFLGGVLAISALVLPGVSGAFVLLLLGLYHFVFYSLSQVITYRDPGSALVVAIFVTALVIGLLTFVRVVKRLLTRWRDGTLAVLTGLMVGSLRKLWPFTDYTAEGREVATWPDTGDPAILSVALLFALGMATVVVLDRAGRRRQRPRQDSNLGPTA